MKKIVLLISVMAFSINCGAHSGRTDANGGHNCSQKSKDKGLCTGYHYHNSKLVEVKEAQPHSNSTSSLEANTLMKLAPESTKKDLSAAWKKVVIDNS